MSTPARIALLKPSSLGDIVHALPVLTAVRTLYPAAEITWIVHRAFAELLHGHPHLDGLITLDRGLMRRSWWRGSLEAMRVLRQIRARRFDLVLDLQGLLRSGIMCWWSGAPRTLGFANAREGARWCYREVVAVPADVVHAVDRNWLFVAHLGGGHLAKQFLLPTNPAAESWAAATLARHARPWWAVNLGTRWETKRWPVRHFVQLLERAMAKYAGTAILVGGPDESRLGQEFIAQARGPAVNLIGQTTLPQLTAVLRLADVMVSNDSGPLHLADALGKPVVAPYTCTSPARTGPYHGRGGAVPTGVACAASYLKRCDKMICMTELIPDRLFPAVEAALQSCSARHSA
jgi:lipopolysaccharide heptosyltransferase I